MPPLAVRASSSPENPFGTASATPPLTVFSSSPGPSHFSLASSTRSAAVDGLASDVAVHVAEHDAAVHGVGVDAAAHVFDDDAAVGGVHTDVGLARHLQLVRDRPVAVIVPVAGAAAIAAIARTVGADASAGRGDLDLLWRPALRRHGCRPTPSRARASARRLDPSREWHAAVAARVEVDRCSGLRSVSSRTSQKSARRS